MHSGMQIFSGMGTGLKVKFRIRQEISTQLCSSGFLQEAFLQFRLPSPFLLTIHYLHVVSVYATHGLNYNWAHVSAVLTRITFEVCLVVERMFTVFSVSQFQESLL